MPKHDLGRGGCYNILTLANAENKSRIYRLEQTPRWPERSKIVSSGEVRWVMSDGELSCTRS